MNYSELREYLMENYKIQQGRLYKILSNRPVTTYVSNRYRNVYLPRYKKAIGEHRLVYLMHYGTMPDIIDHIDGNRTNNDPANLRSVTRAENNQNIGASRANRTTRCRGVAITPKGRYVAKLTHNKQCYYLGTFDTITEASKAYEAKAEELRGSFYRKPAN